jgi:RNA polymerase sigma-70 factor (ECF subfamily)
VVDFRELFDSQLSYVWGVLRRLGVREADTEDLALEVFLHVHRRIAEYDESRPVRPWLFGFAYRIAARHRQKAHLRREVLGDAPDAASAHPSAEDQLATRQARDVVHEALDGVDLDRRAVLVLHDWDGVPITEVAEALGIPLNTAYSRLRVAREELTAAVKRLCARRGGGRP